MRARMIVRGIFGVTAVATGLALCAPASAAPASRQTQQMTCDGFGSLLIVTPPTDHDSWSAAQVVGGGHLIPVSFRSLVQDDTADVVLYDGTVSH
ncbi:MAG TPA: hypothetical protein VLS51_10045, partial [Propionibacteriaceae bacterium]|nr:hypothetical protein [Propionibacteriaceae bacterium]